MYFVIMVLAIFNIKLLKFFKSRLFQKMENDDFLNNGEEAIFIHFSSVGEFNLTKELISEILEEKKTGKKEKVILSVMTNTGFEAVSKEYSENGYGKQTAASEYPIKGRGGKGIKTTNITEKNGPLAGLTTVNGDEDIMVITDKGVMIRFKISDVSETGRATLGVRLINLGADSIVSTMTKVEPEDENENSEETTQEVSTEISDDTKDSDVARLLDAAQKDGE
ncbi:MAG: DNA gyrase C-terminal beta-propeller domain-containing protein [Leptotrichia wadei]